MGSTSATQLGWGVGKGESNEGQKLYKCLNVYKWKVYIENYQFSLIKTKEPKTWLNFKLKMFSLNYNLLCKYAVLNIKMRTYSKRPWYYFEERERIQSYDSVPKFPLDELN